MNKQTEIDASKFFADLLASATERDAMFYSMGVGDCLRLLAGLPPLEASALMTLWQQTNPDGVEEALSTRGVLAICNATGIAEAARVKVFGGSGRMN